MTIQRLVGPQTHICWTPDGKPKERQELVVLVRAADLERIERRIARLEEENNEMWHTLNPEGMGR